MGFKKSQVARQLNLNIKTVRKYWGDMDAEAFSEHLQQGGTRSQKLDNYHDIILGWLRQFPTISGAQVMDWLKEHLENVPLDDMSRICARNTIYTGKKLPANTKQWQIH